MASAELPPVPAPQGWAEVAVSLAGEGQVQVYFLLLGIAMTYCYSRCKHWWQIIAATSIVGVTWYYICVFTVEYESAHPGGSEGDRSDNGLFDAAYLDVTRAPHFRLSSQLLTWVVVAMVWAHEANITYLLFGILGAMSAAFITWVPLEQPSSRKVPMGYFLFSFVSLLAIHELQAVLPSEATESLGDVKAPAVYGFWLQLLHVSLVLPKLLSMLMPFQPRLDATPLYFMLGLAVAAWHAYLATLQEATWPITACQISIDCDMVLCALITVYAVWQRFGGAAAGVALAATPILSPGAVLAFHLTCVHFGDFHGELVTRFQLRAARQKRSAAPTRSQEQIAASFAVAGHGDTSNSGAGISDSPARNTRSRRKANGAPPKANLASTGPDLSQAGGASGTVASRRRTWMNLGMWTEGSGYDEACQRLAFRLGTSVLSAGDAVLACGCGYGDELHYYKQTFRLRHITGIDVNEDACKQFEPQHNVRLLHQSTEGIAARFGPGYFTKIVSLDNVYHYPDKERFFGSAAALLLPGGKVGVTDILLRPSAPAWLRLVLSLMNIPGKNLWDRAHYRETLNRCGLDCEVLEPLTGVLSEWFPAWLSQHLEYCVVVAVKAPASGQTAAAAKPRPTVAIVGSGISGLTSANILSATHDVTIFESQPQAGLSGSAATLHGFTMDIPLRMIGDGYYTYVIELAKSLNVPLVDARADCCWWGESGPAGVVAYSSRTLENLWTGLRVLSHLPACIRFGREVSNSRTDSEQVRGESWGQWLDRHGYDKQPNGSCSSTMFMWAITGQLSWLLSCSHEQVRGYPSHIILDFFQKLGISLSSMFEPSSDIKRVSPSVDQLQLAMSYGCELMCNTRVTGLGGDRVIDGRKFDKVIIATEASAVPKILKSKEHGDLFGRVVYQPSHILLHRDASMMPDNRADWKALNVCQRDNEDMCMLTVWMNEYYPESNLPHDIFQTWNPYHRPADSLIMKEAHFLRVVHTKDLPQLLKQIQDLQGKDGMYFVGSYCADGMGLLEQAANSAKVVAEGILSEASAKGLI